MPKITELLIPIICLCVFEIYSETAKNDLWVMPETYVDDGKPYMEFTCGAHLKKGERLMWSKWIISETFTEITQQNEDGYKSLKLLWPLQEAKDKSGDITCRRTGVPPASKKISISIKRDVQTLDSTNGPWVWPETTTVDSPTNTVDLTCWAYLYMNKTVTWYQKQGTSSKILAKIQQEAVFGYVTLPLRKHLQPDDDGTGIYCEQVNRDGSTTETQKISLIYRNNEVLTEETPQVIPNSFSEDGKSLLDFTCRAYLKTKDLLSWFHVKGSNKTERLETIQQDITHGYKEIKLLKGLKPSDNNTQIYCARETISSTGEWIKGPKSNKIPISFQKETPYVTIKPSKEIIIYTDKQKLPLLCSGSEPLSNRSYTWYIEGPNFQQLPLKYQHFDESSNQNLLTLPLEKSYHHRTQVYCAQDYQLNVVTGNGPKRVSYGELVRSKVITLLYEGKGNLEDNPLVTPKTFEDQRKSSVEFSCFAFARSGDVLSWYQAQPKGSVKSEDKLLKIVQIQKKTYKSGQWSEVILNKTLEQSDNYTDVYCTKQTVTSDGLLSKKLTSELIPVRVQNDIKTMESFIKIEPSANVSFEINATLIFNCSGSPPVDGRSYTWFRIDSESKLTVPEKQTQVSRNLTVLKLSLKESYDQNQLFCAQGFFAKIQHKGGSLIMPYDVVVTSDKITLIRKQDGKEVRNCTNSLPGLSLGTILGIAIPLTLLVMVAATVTAYVVRRRRAPCPAPAAPEREENLYANVSRNMGSSEVTYAELQFSPHSPQSANRLKIPNETCEYATIVPKAHR